MTSPFHLETFKKLPTKQYQYNHQHFQLTPKNDTISTPQNPKNLQVTSAKNRGVTKSELQEVIHLIQNTMQTFSAFEKHCSVQ